MASGLELRSQIDTETVKGLLLINGGGAVAMLAFLPTVLGKPEFVPLAKTILIGLLLCQIGLLAAVVHNRLRRICSLAYESQKFSPVPCRLFGRTLREPCVCVWNIAFMWFSILLFFAAGVIVFLGGILIVWK